MKCPRCNTESQVLETRKQKRRRRCLSPSCGHRFSTIEVRMPEIHALRGDQVRLVRVRNIVNEERK